MSQKESYLERKFHLSALGTNVRTEIMAGLTTFMTMSYILIVNPNILADAGMDKGGVFTATIVASVIGTIFMGLFANLPFALAPGMGLNAFFAYTVVLAMGKPWTYALTAVFLEGIIFIILSFFNVREALFNAIPITLKKAVSVGIGLFITLIGLQNAGITVAGEGTLIELGNLLTPGAAVAFFGLIVASVLTVKNVKGALLYGIIGSTILALILGVAPLPSGIIQGPPSLSKVAFHLEFSDIFSFEMLGIVFTFLFVDIFDTVGTLTGVATKANLLDDEGKLPKVGAALSADAIATTCGALLGTSTVTTFVESASGVADGGRSGLTAISTAFFFFVSLFLFPLISIVPGQATASALILVGLFMMSPVRDIDFNDFTESIPAFITIVFMPFAYGIANGIYFGMISYVLLKLVGGRKKDISPLMYGLALVFILKIIYPALIGLF